MLQCVLSALVGMHRYPNKSCMVPTAGLMTLMAVKAFGADAVAITDIKRDNLDLAMKLGADVALNPDRDAAPQEVATWMRAALPPNGPDIVIDCAGFEPTLQVQHLLFLPYVLCCTHRADCCSL